MLSQSKQLINRLNFKQLHAKLQQQLHYNQRSTLPYNAQEFFQVVYEVEQYHNFLPWCSNSIIHKRRGFSYFEAELFINFRVYQDSYISKVSSEITKNSYQIISQSNNISAFKELKSTWKIQPLSDNTCLIDYDIDFEFKNTLFQAVAQMFLDNVIKKINSSFETRLQYLRTQDYFQHNLLPVFANLNNQQIKLQQQQQQCQDDKNSKESKYNYENVEDKQGIQMKSNIQQNNTNQIAQNDINSQQINQFNDKTKIQESSQNYIKAENNNEEIDLKQEIKQHINLMVLQNIAKEEDASIFINSLLKNPEQKEIIMNAYKFFILKKGLINMNEEQANWKFLSFLRQTTLYK